MRRKAECPRTNPLALIAASGMSRHAPKYFGNHAHASCKTITLIVSSALHVVPAVINLLNRRRAQAYSPR
jgi:hypothetical protein